MPVSRGLDPLKTEQLLRLETSWPSSKTAIQERKTMRSDDKSTYNDWTGAITGSNMAIHETASIYKPLPTAVVQQDPQASRMLTALAEMKESLEQKLTIRPNELTACLVLIAAIQNLLAARVICTPCSLDPCNCTQEEYASVKEAAEELGLSKGHLYQLIRNNQFPAIPVGKRRYRIRISDLRNWKGVNGKKSLDAQQTETYVGRIRGPRKRPLVKHIPTRVQ